MGWGDRTPAQEADYLRQQARDQAGSAAYTTALHNGQGPTAASAYANTNSGGAPAIAPQSPEMQDYMAKLHAAANTRPGENAQDTPYYATLRDQSRKRDEAYGWGAGASDAASGSISGPGYGAGRRESTQRAQNAADAARADLSSATQMKTGQDAQYFDQLLKAAGFTQGITDSQWEKEYRVWAAKQGISQAQADRDIETMRAYFGLAGGIAGVVGGAIIGGPPGAAAGGTLGTQAGQAVAPK